VPNRNISQRQIVPITIEIDNENCVVVATASGRLTMDELYKYQVDMWTAKEYREYNELFDLTRVEAFVPPTSENIKDFSDFAATMEVDSVHSKLAIVAEGDFEFGLARMFQVFRETHPQSRKEVAVFRTVPEAMKFLKAEKP
jgi:hypothetical protein